MLLSCMSQEAVIIVYVYKSVAIFLSFKLFSDHWCYIPFFIPSPKTDMLEGSVLQTLMLMTVFIILIAKYNIVRLGKYEYSNVSWNCYEIVSCSKAHLVLL